MFVSDQRQELLGLQATRTFPLLYTGLTGEVPRYDLSEAVPTSLSLVLSIVYDESRVS